MADVCSECEGYETVIVNGEEVHCSTCDLRAEIERLRAEIERLRAAGDALAEALDALCHSYCGNEDDADLVDAWREARRD